MKSFFGLPLLALTTCSIALAAPAKPKTAPPVFEPKAHALLKQVFDHYRALHSYSGTTRWAYDGPLGENGYVINRTGKLEVRVAQPKLFLDRTEDGDDLRFRFWDDGEIIYEEIPQGHVIRQHHISLHQDDLWGGALTSEFGIRALLQNRNPLQPYGSYIKSIAMIPEPKASSKTKTGEAHIVVQLKAPQATALIEYVVGVKDLSLHTLHLHQVVNGKTLDQNEEYQNVKLNTAIPAAEINAGAETIALADEVDKRLKEKYPSLFSDDKPTPPKPVHIPGVPDGNFPTDNGQ